MTDPHLATPSGKARARSLGVPFDGTPGKYNAITDVPGVAVGYSTIIRGEGPLVIGQGPVRTGVTAILPRGHENFTTPVFAGSFSLNGAGEMTGTIWVEESGQCEGPITITNTHSCGVARDATIRWIVDNHPAELANAWGLPVAGETYDGELNDINGFHVTSEHVFEAIEGASSGALEMGSVGGGTGMICYDFKGGSGSASRRVGDYTVGAFVQANFGMRSELTIAGVPVGRHISGGEVRSKPQGSIIAIAATDAPLMPHQLKRLARRVGLGVGRSGSIAHNGSGDIFLAFSTANMAAWAEGAEARDCAFLPNHAHDPLFAAVIQATDEAIIDAMVANETMTGRDGTTVMALPHDRLQEILGNHNRLSKSP
ncbi:MAG: P1 family peptidase [Alphaproteobacteria bacterium]|jgi:L-aminopeptidase/D-esterase-like protein